MIVFGCLYHQLFIILSILHIYINLFHGYSFFTFFTKTLFYKHRCHFDAWDNYLLKNGTRVHHGTAAINQHGGTLIVTQSEFTMLSTSSSDDVLSYAPTHVWLGPNASKTIVSENIVKGLLNIKNNGKGKIVVVNNLDDSPLMKKEL